MDENLRIEARPLTRQEAAAVRHLLTHSALAHCDGRHGRIVLHTNLDGEDALTVADLHTWGWSSGEAVLLQGLLHIVGEARMPTDLHRVDDDNRRVLSEALALALPASERAGLERLLAAVEATDTEAVQ